MSRVIVIEAHGQGTRDDYRMLAAIIETKAAGNYFVKFYGPKATIAENEKAFQELLLSLVVK